MSEPHYTRTAQSIRFRFTGKGESQLSQMIIIVTIWRVIRLIRLWNWKLLLIAR